ncbi:MAG: sigma-70 family RNA polymerase sigma factor [Polyangiales bacterium]
MIRAEVTAAMHGDDQALTALVRAYHARVRRFGQRVCADTEDADDAVQEAFARLMNRPDVVQHPGALSWLMTVVRNACARLLRPFHRRRRSLGQPVEDLEAVESAEPGADEALARFEMIHAVHTAIAALPRASREIIVLRDLEGMSGEQTCATLDIELPAMKSRLHRARAELRAELARTWRRGE